MISYGNGRAAPRAKLMAMVGMKRRGKAVVEMIEKRGGSAPLSAIWQDLSGGETIPSLGEFYAVIEWLEHKGQIRQEPGTEENGVVPLILHLSRRPGV